jgi:hypothetical protein
MFMRFIGGGIRHRATRYLGQSIQEPFSNDIEEDPDEIMSNAESELIGPELDTQAIEDDANKDGELEDVDSEEEADFGYGDGTDSDASDEEEAENDDDNDSEDL